MSCSQVYSLLTSTHPVLFLKKVVNRGVNKLKKRKKKRGKETAQEEQKLKGKC